MRGWGVVAASFPPDMLNRESPRVSHAMQKLAYKTSHTFPTGPVLKASKIHALVRQVISVCILFALLWHPYDYQQEQTLFNDLRHAEYKRKLWRT